MGYWDFYPRYVSVGERRAKAERKLKQLRKKNPDIQPVTIKGRTLARTWWGKAWNENLERYADYSNRIGRGRSYVRHSAVLDLKIRSGKVEALVQGSESKPYSVTIHIQEIDKNTWKHIREQCEGELESLSELMTGKFPESLKNIFMSKGKGLFPSPKEIKFSCSCPDWASMCKHVAATLYGVGARLDEDPSLFFKLRKADMNDLITKAVEDKTQKLLKKSEKKTSRVMDEADLSDVFGIDFEESANPVLPKKRKTNPGKKRGKAEAGTENKTALNPGTTKKAATTNNPVKKVFTQADPVKKKMKHGKKTAEKAESGKKTVAAKAKTKPVKKAAAKAEPLKKTAAKTKTVKKTAAKTESVKKSNTKTNPVKKTVKKASVKTNMKKTWVKVELVKRSSPKKTVRKELEEAAAKDKVVRLIRRSRKGITMPDIRKKTGLTVMQIRNAIDAARKEGKIKSETRGVYIKA